MHDSDKTFFHFMIWVLKKRFICLKTLTREYIHAYVQR